MNKVFKIVWNQALQSWVVVSEFAKSHGKSSTTVNSIAVAALMAASPSFAATVAIGGSENINNVGNKPAEAAVASGSQAVAIGQKAKATGASTVALGDTATASAINAVAVGYSANATHNYAVAVGVKAKAQASGTVAIGNNATANHTGSIVLGDNSVSAGDNTVSVGSTSKQRRITNVAEGKIAEGSSDAITGGQLYSEIEKLKTASTSGSSAKNYFHVNASKSKVEAGTSDNLDAVGGAGGAKAPRSLAAGVDAQVESQYSMAIGDGATITKSATDLTTTGGVQVAGHQQSSNSLAVGTQANVTGQKSVAIGYKANVTAPIFDQTSGVAIGDEAAVNAKNSVAIGHWAVAKAGGQGSAMALGDQAEALNTYALAMGTRATASNDHSTAIAKNAKAYSQYGVAIGVDALAGELIEESKTVATTNEEKKVSTTVLGPDPDTINHPNTMRVQVQDGKNVIIYKVKGYGETAIGKDTLASGSRSTAIGIESQATADRATAIANNAKATALRSTAIGNLANASNAYALAIGDDTKASGSSSMAVGQGSIASGMNSGAIGKGANSTGVGGFAIGTSSKALENHTLAIGTSSVTNTRFGIAMGNEAQSGTNVTTGYRAIAIGNKANASKNDSIALGSGAQALENTATSIGRNAINSGSASVAIGDNVKLSETADRTVVIGRENTVTRSDNVILGSHASEDSATINAGSYDTATGQLNVKVNSATVGSMNYAGFSGSRSAGVVSIGRDVADHENGDGGDGERRLINVGAGEISARSTDAINGSQLYAVANSIPATYTDTSGNPLTKIGDKFYTPGNYVVADGEVYPEGSVVFKGNVYPKDSVIAKGNIYPAGTTLDSDGNPPAGVSPLPAVTTVSPVQQFDQNVVVSLISPDENKTANAPTTLANVAGNLDGATKKADGSFTDAPKTVSTGTLPTGTALNNAATVGDVLNAGWNLKHSDGKATSPVVTEKDFVRHADNVVFANGNATTATIDVSDEGKTSTIKYDVNVDGDTITINSEGKLVAKQTVDTNTVTTVSGTGAVSVTGGTGTGDKAYVVSLNTDNTLKLTGDNKLGVNVDDITIKVNADGQLYAVVNDTNTVTKVEDGNTTKVTSSGVGTANPTYKVEVNKATVVATPTDTASGTDITVNNAGKVVAPTTAANKDNHFVTADVLTTVVNAAGFTLKTSETTGGSKVSGADEVINPGETVDMTAGKNLTVKQEANGKVTYATKDDVNFNSVQFGENGPKINNNGGNINVGSSNGAPVKITGVADGDITPTSKDAVNGSQLYALAGNNNYNGTYTVTNPDGTTTTYENVVTDENGQALMKTYNVYGGGNYLTNSAAEAINKMNEGGIKFFHVNNGSNKFADQDFNDQDSRAKGTFSTAIGYQTQANGTASVAIGNISEAKGEQSIAIGDRAKANGTQSIAIGTGNVVSGNHSGAIGDPTVVTGDSAYSIGNNNTIATDNTYALGSNITATAANSVFLGDKSASFEQAGSTKASSGAHVAQGTTESAYTYRAENDANVAGKNAVGVVSVGNANESRQIQGVAAGVVSATSTDAINGSQLFYTNKAIQNDVDNKINKLGDVVNKNNRQLRAGIAGTNAAASLPQVYLPGKSMVAASAGTFKGEGALAVGYSRASDNGKVILKLQGNANTRGDFGAGVGVGYQW